MAKNEKERGFLASIFFTIGNIVGSLLHDALLDDPERPGVLRFSLPGRIYHWTVAFLIILMGITGLIFFVPGWGAAAVGGWAGAIHRVCAYLFVLVLILYFVSFPKKSLDYIKESFTWTKDDLAWAGAALDYYTGGDESKMPPQGHINAGQKIWQLITIICGIIFLITGAIMCFAKGYVPPVIFQWTLFTHALVFIIGGCMLIVHIVLGTVHPRMSESFRSIITGKVSEEYAKSHYGKWYEKIPKGKKLKE
jgi:formate dehydrogenase gamma subunit